MDKDLSRRESAWLAWVMLGSTSCLGEVASDSPGTQDASNPDGLVASVDAGGEGEANVEAAALRCPSEAPEAGSACQDEGEECSWGADPRFVCRTRATCEGDTWRTATTSCSELSPPTCPADPSAPASGLCERNLAESPGDLLKCLYDIGPHGRWCRCVRAAIVGAAPPAWTCYDRDVPDPGCPSNPPNLGDSCGQIERCAYAYPMGEDGSCRTTLRCTARTWKLEEQVCIE